MRKNKTSSLLYIAAAILTGVLPGCTADKNPVDVVLSPSSANPSGENVAKRFREPNTQGRTAVESAIELSEKYAKLSDQTVALRERNQSLLAENTDLKKRVSELESKLMQTQKELNEANDLLIEMLTELNNWKGDVLGFRNEMREASKAQLEALLRILETLGGQIEAHADTDRNTAGPAGGAGPETVILQDESEPNTKR